MNIPFASASEGYTVIPTGLPQLDRILGIGGIPFKKITEISGQWSVGKTTLALSLVKSAQEHGYKSMWIDAEWAWDGEYAKSLGVDTEKLMFLQTRAAEDSLNTLLEYVEKGKNTLIIIDAVGALHSREEAEKDAESRTIGAQSALIARFCRKIVPMLALNNNALVVLNHEYTPIISTGGRPQVMTSGGKKLEYHKSIWIRLMKTGSHLKVGEDFVGFRVEAEIRKNKCAPTQKQSCELDMFYGKGFSAVSDLLQQAQDKGVITRVGNTFFFLGAKIGTKAKLTEWIKEHEEEVKEALV
jgi:recombination protein RecA